MCDLKLTEDFVFYLSLSGMFPVFYCTSLNVTCRAFLLLYSMGEGLELCDLKLTEDFVFNLSLSAAENKRRPPPKISVVWVFSSQHNADNTSPPVT